MNAAESSYQITSRTDTFRIYELVESSTDSRVQICPERGGIVIGCQLNGKELLYLDRATFLDPKSNIRGGIPVLFPICGQLVGGEYEWEGVTSKMRNHGVSRTEVWEVAEQNKDGEASLTVVQRSDETTLAAYPFEFELRFTYRLKNGNLTIDQSYRNLSDRPMPVQAGFHPYFATGEGKKLTYRSDATKLLDYNDNQVKPFDGTFDLSGKVESSALLDAKTPSIAFPLADKGTITLDYSEAFNKVVLWSVQGKPFICVEPWTALNEALNTKEGLIMVAPGEALELDLNISFAKR
ncbi:aldose epimerase [Cohnella lubricantis]|uniref:Aldose epimerase n=1 Tax=Cohnella lubricantis TaxID=2163172 RepID=A0A841TEZ1_9BACL|nr:aldose epimerase [Cohnella lubricantis]MBB6678645.1 aldose epimerase [Cohnella lubricantis]MBP2119195.1 galactose mutarotase-like enzyme [Cohnella lubricantis]